MDTPDTITTRPYLIRALHEWCGDNGLTPYIAVRADDDVQVPREHVKNGEIVLNISLDATSSLRLGNDFIEFKARFSGVAREVIVPVDRVMAIYARENGQGMAFPLESGSRPATEAGPPAGAQEAGGEAGADARPALHLMQTETRGDDDPVPPRPAGGGPRPALKRVK